MDSHSKNLNSFYADDSQSVVVDYLCNTLDTIFLIYGGNNATIF